MLIICAAQQSKRPLPRLRLRTAHASCVIPGRREAASPESIITDSGYGFRAPSLRSGPGMTAEVRAAAHSCQSKEPPMHRPFATLDVFTDRRFAGNPLAVVR